MMSYFKKSYADPSTKLSLERAVDLDFLSDVRASSQDMPMVYGAGADEPSSTFCEDAYRQPVLTEEAGVPLPYRGGEMDDLTREAIQKLKTKQTRYARMANPRSQSVACRTLRSFNSGDSAQTSPIISQGHGDET